MNPNNYYIAGFFDGEGSCDGTRISITNTDKGILGCLSQYLSEIGIENKICSRKKSKPHYKDAYDIRIYGRANVDKFYTYIPFKDSKKRHNMLGMIVRTKSVISNRELKEMKKDKDGGWSYRYIAKKYNYPLNTVHRYLTGHSQPNN